MPAVLDSAQHGTVLPAPAQQTALDRLIRLAVERSRAQLAAHGQHLHVEAMAPQVRVFGDPEALVEGACWPPSVEIDHNCDIRHYSRRRAGCPVGSTRTSVLREAG